MTSVRSLLQQSNGNEWLPNLGLVLLLLIASCSTPKKVIPPSQPVPPKTESKPEVFNPTTGKYETATPANTRVDTIIWKDSGKEPYIQDKSNNPVGSKNDPGHRYRISLLLPLSDEDIGKDMSTEGSEKYFHYYAGVKMGAEKIKDSLFSVDINIIDLKPSMAALNNILKDPKVATSDLILGPLRRDQISETAKFAREKNILMAAPWNSFRTIENLSANYILLKASLPTHCETLAKYIMSQNKFNDICLVGREKSTALMNYFENEFQRLNNGVPVMIARSTVKDDFKFSDDYKYLDTTKSVYVVTEYEEPDVVFNFLRHLNQMRKTKEITVIGMPSWLDYSRDFMSLFSQLKVVISSSTFVDINSDNVIAFRKSFFQEYQNFPLKEAYEGYDAIIYLSKMLNEFGKGFNYYGDVHTYSGISTDYKLEKVIEANTPVDDRLNANNIECIENKALYLLRYDQFRFNKIQ
ncbi:MAG: hypothetical protein ABI761_05945 [Saprospiraceae bacterium]